MIIYSTTNKVNGWGINIKSWRVYDVLFRIDYRYFRVVK